MEAGQAKRAKEEIKKAEQAVLEAAEDSKGELKEDLTDAEFALEKAEAEIEEQEQSE